MIRRGSEPTLSVRSQTPTRASSIGLGPLESSTPGSSLSAEEHESYWVHPSSYVDDGAIIGDETDIWHFVHVTGKAIIGSQCMVGQGCYVAGVIGDHSRIQNNVSVYEGVFIGRRVFVGPSVVFTNDRYPIVSSDWKMEQTHIQDGASIGANATIRCGVTIGPEAMIGCGAVVLEDVPAGEVWAGVPAKRIK